MTWLAYRQFRLAALVAMAVLAAVIILLALTPTAEIASCAGQSGCPDLHSFLRIRHDHLVKILGTLLVGVPALVGAFWGAPLIARELETGTYRLAWTQSVSRSRWLATKLALLTAVAAVFCGVWSLVLGWWSSAAYENGRLAPVLFSQRGIVPIGYGVFAVALGVAFGLVIRRTLPAMAATLVTFTAVRMVTQYLVRFHLAPVRHAITPVNHGLGFELSGSTLTLIAPPVTLGNDWVGPSRLVDSAGHGPTSQFAAQACHNALTPPPAPPGRGVTNVPPSVERSMNRCITHVSARFHVEAAYQPTSHYWALQGAETAIFLALAAILVGASFWWLRNRLT